MKRLYLVIAASQVVFIFLLCVHFNLSIKKTVFKKDRSVDSLAGNEMDSISRGSLRMNNIMEERRRNLRSRCSEYGLNKNLSSDQAYLANPFLKTSLFYSDKYKVLYCMIPKCGSSNQARFLVVSEGLTKEKDPNKVRDGAIIAEKYLSARRISNIEEMKYRIDEYRKVVLVREPFSRLLSAFRNKLENNSRNDGYAGVARNIQRRFRNDSATESSGAPHVTLSDFIKYLTEPGTSAQNDQHWNFFHRLCSPCDIHYDVIMHMETLEEDMKYLMKERGMNGTKFPSSYNSFTDWKKVEKYFARTPPELVNALYKTYKMDYDLFGYPAPPQF